MSVWDGHKDKVYRAQWSPRLPNIFASVSGKYTIINEEVCHIVTNSNQ